MPMVVVSGASRGIGLAIVETSLDDGHEVIALGRDPDNAGDLAKLRDAQPRLNVIWCDVAEAASVEAMRREIGDRPIDRLFNVAGVMHVEKRPEDIDFEAWRTAFEVMALGPVRVTLALLPNLEAAGGKVVSLTSQAASSTWDRGGVYSYASAKAALNRAMKSLAVDLKPRGVAVALVHPGVVKTRLGGPDARLEPSDSARGIRAVADGLQLATTGGFFDWNGAPHAW